MTGADGLARDLDSLGLWRGLSDDVRESNVAEVAAGVHPWATTIADDVAFFADGEDLADGGVVQFLAELSEPLAALGVVLDAETISDASTGTYVVSINGSQVDLYDEASWDASSETEHPWFTSTVRPLAVVNGLLRDAGAVERLSVLYPGGNEGIALLIDPEIVSRIVDAGLDDENEIPLEAK